jgi:hypothetical protein
MKPFSILLIGALLNCRAAELSMVPVFQDDTHQFTGVAISKTGRMFVNYPRWQSPHQYDVVEVTTNGNVRPYPDSNWNSWNKTKVARTNGCACRRFMWMTTMNYGSLIPARRK